MDRKEKNYKKMRVMITKSEGEIMKKNYTISYVRESASPLFTPKAKCSTSWRKEEKLRKL